MRKHGFTLIELVVVVSIMALLIGILVPSFGNIKEQVKGVGQKAQLRDIALALESFRVENDFEYPDSYTEGTTYITTGSHKLAEALVGRDLQGFDDNSSWDAEADEGVVTIYDPLVTTNRNKPILELNNIGAYQLSQIYGDQSFTPAPYLGDILDDGVSLGPNNSPAYVFTDIFKDKKITTVDGETVKVGTPILYFKASRSSEKWEISNASSSQIFTFSHNMDMMIFGHISSGETHPYMGPVADGGFDSSTGTSELFQEALINPRYPSIGGNYVPYNRDSFILMSAGSDGLYGTRDDIFNISKR